MSNAVVRLFSCIGYASAVSGGLTTAPILPGSTDAIGMCLVSYAR